MAHRAGIPCNDTWPIWAIRRIPACRERGRWPVHPKHPRMMDANTPIGKFWWLVGYYAAEHPEQRPGQATFNVLAAVRPDLSEQIRATELDPFYLADRLDATCQWIEKHWKDSPET